MRTPDVTFVIATYRRVDALRSTLRSVRLQTHGDWTALVIGDRCGDETAQMLRGFRDPRIRYYNLPERFGEQSGPNSAGLHLASSEFVAFLNHDDLLVQDHVAHMLERLAAADFCFGRFANATGLRDGMPVFTSIGPRHTDLSVLIRTDPWLFDPSSFWMIRTAYAKAVGPWRRAHEVWRTPLRDWLLRAWRRRGRFSFGTRVTGLRFLTRTEAPAYAHATPEHAAMADLLEREPPDRIRAFAESGIEGASGDARPPWLRAVSRARQRLWGSLYLRFGIDREAILGPFAGRRKGDVLGRLSRMRTGEPLPAEATLAAFLRDPEAHRLL